jgi:hypothetical protein
MGKVRKVSSWYLDFFGDEVMDVTKFRAICKNQHLEKSLPKNYIHHLI